MIYEANKRCLIVPEFVRVYAVQIEMLRVLDESDGSMRLGSSLSRLKTVNIDKG